MLTYIKRFIVFLLFSLGMAMQSVKAQDLNIAGDTIYVNAEAEVMVRFPTLPTFFNTVPSDAPYNFKTAGTGFTIIAKAERTKPAPLFVTEGGRNHRFVIVFKKNINYNNDAEIDYDYSTTKKLEEHIRDAASGRSKEAPKNEVAKPEEKTEKKKKTGKKEENNASNYYALLEEGDNNIKQKNYSAAKLNFEKALSLRPDDLIPKQRLEEVKIRISETERAAEQEKTKQYIAITKAAKANLDSKKYDLAQDGYKKALELKPGDLYATNQLQNISKLIHDETGKKEQQKLDDLYKEYLATGEKAFKKNQLTDARIAFEQALVIKPNDPVASGRMKVIEDKEKKQKESEDLENNYNSAIQAADKSFKAGEYESAKLEYTKAIGLINRPWPQDQLKNINKILDARLAKEKEDKLANDSKLEAKRKEKEKANLEANYNAAIKSADKYFKDKNYEKAITGYSNALSIDKRPWPEEQLKTIQKLMDQEEAEKKKTAVQAETDKQAKERKKKDDKQKLALEKQYKAAVQEADKLFKDRNYAAAKDAYTKAAGLSTNSWPQEQIAAIDKIINEQLAKDKAEKIRLAQEAEINAKYTTAMEKANSEFDKGNYAKARKLYTDASLIKPSEKLPKEKLDLIQSTLDHIAATEKARKDSLAAATELKKKYSLAMSRAKSYFLKDDLVNAKNAYTEASNLKPAEPEPKSQLKLILARLDEQAKASEINTRYEQKVAVADSQLIMKAYDAALITYKEAIKIKPSEYYPQTQINYIEAEIRNMQKEKEARDKLEAYRKEAEQDQKYRDALKRANQAVNDKKFDIARTAYQEVLNIRPEDDYAKQRLKIVNFQLEKEKELIAKKPDDTNPPGKEKNNKTGKKQDKQTKDADIVKPAPVPYTDAELKVKYPGIDFTTLPPEQPFNEGAVNSFDNTAIFRDMLSEKQRLTLSATAGKMKLTCQGINFVGADIYIKFQVQNNDNTDFLTGAMMLTWTKRSGNKIKLYPSYLYPSFLPIVTPGKSAVIIYVCKSYYINDNEKLNFELNDRLNKIKFEITIPGSAYNDEESRILK